MSDATSTVADELAIRNLIARAAHVADSGTDADVTALWVPDGVWTSSTEGIRSGIDEIVAGAHARRASKTSGTGSGARHLITTVQVAFDDPDHARVESNFLFCRSTPTGSALIEVLGHYSDEVRRTSDGWRFNRRDITFGGADAPALTPRGGRGHEGMARGTGERATRARRHPDSWTERTRVH